MIMTACRLGANHACVAIFQRAVCFCLWYALLTSFLLLLVFISSPSFLFFTVTGCGMQASHGVQEEAVSSG